MSKRLVTYFSASGVTAKVAENLADAIGADIFEIQPEVPYTKADLNWMDKKARTTIEMSDPTSRPAIAAKRDNIDEYDTIFVGFPIWWYVYISLAGFAAVGARAPVEDEMDDRHHDYGQLDVLMGMIGT